MSSQAVALLAEARGRRERAQHVLRLAWGIGDEQAAKALKDFAAELNRQAADLENRARHIADVASSIKDELQKAHHTISEIMDTLSKGDPKP